MAAPAEVSEKRSNFRIRQFKEKRLFNIAANLTLNTMASFVILLTARTARIACSDRHTYRQTDRQTDRHTHTYTRDNYCNPLCACAPRVNKCAKLFFVYTPTPFEWGLRKPVPQSPQHSIDKQARACCFCWRIACKFVSLLVNL